MKRIEKMRILILSVLLLLFCAASCQDKALGQSLLYCLPSIEFHRGCSQLQERAHREVESSLDAQDCFSTVDLGSSEFTVLVGLGSCVLENELFPLGRCSLRTYT